eukprot:GHVS01099963.1.p1 GENE.GHVS01099963.1~~GHVS01099963.1.p1  ORF type:complete len:103 (-),score=13.36 GHVS01099963.1:28-336(-)
MNKITTRADKAPLREFGCMEVVGEMMVSHPLNASAIRSGTELFAKVGADSQISSLMQQIIENKSRHAQLPPARLNVGVVVHGDLLPPPPLVARTSSFCPHCR